MLPCNEIVKILSSAQELSFPQKLELRVHLFMCKHCSAYSKELKAMTIRLIQNFREITVTQPEHVRELEKKVIDKVKKASNSTE